MLRLYVFEYRAAGNEVRADHRLDHGDDLNPALDALELLCQDLQQHHMIQGWIQALLSCS